MEIIDFGIRDYEEVLNLQEELFEQLIEDKKTGKSGKEYLLVGEHLPVITKGRRAQDENILWPLERIKESGIRVYKIGRGGDVTYHCPGQLILYPILDLERHHLGVKDYVTLMEETVIKVLQEYGIKGKRVEGASGVWIGKDCRDERKVCAIGIKCNRFCTMHGLALNVNSNLEGFKMINPCGFHDKGVTSIKEELNIESGSIEQINIFAVKNKLISLFIENLPGASVVKTRNKR